MLIMERRRFGVLRNYEVYFAREDQLAELVENLRPFEMLHAFFSSPILSRATRCLVQDQKKTTFVDLSQSQEAVWAGMHSSCRYKIRRAERMHDRFDMATNTEAARADFRKLYNAFARAKRDRNLPLLKPGLSSRYLPYADVFMLYFEDQPTCGRLVLRDEESRTALMLYSATRRLEPGADTITIGLLNRYLHWHEMKTYQAAGMKRYDFGGAADSYPTVTHFKLSFGGQVSAHNYSVYARTTRIPWKILHFLKELRHQRRFSVSHLIA
jgi:hypothetical protein